MEEEGSAVRARLFCVTVLAVVSTAVAAPVGSAGSAAITCGGEASRPFLPWLDPTPYTLAEGGSLESTTGWALSGGARLVAGNEPFYVHSASDTSSLYLPSGSSATTPWSCVGADSLTVRFFAVNSGSLLSRLNVDLLYRTNRGNIRTLGGIDLVTGLTQRTWFPTLPVVIELDTLARDLLVLDLNTTQMALRFTPSSGLLFSGSWKIDDIYVDPWLDRLWG